MEEFNSATGTQPVYEYLRTLSAVVCCGGLVTTRSNRNITYAAVFPLKLQTCFSHLMLWLVHQL